jgi:O-succinylbenzoate synthase
MSSSLVRATLVPLAIPLRRTFTTAGASIDERRVVLVRVGEGSTSGWGEAAPFPGQDEPVEGVVDAAVEGTVPATLAAALDEAVNDNDARIHGVPLMPNSATEVPMCLAVGIDGALGRVADLVDRGVTAVKMKVAPDAIDQVVAVREAYPDLTIGVDGNASFGDLNRLDTGMFIDLALAFAEELFADWVTGGAEAFADMTGIPLFADESIRSVADARRMLALPSVGGVTIKPGRLGWSGALAAKRAALDAGKLWRVSGLLESGVGRAYTNLLAASEGAFVSDVAPATEYFATDLVDDLSGGGVVQIPMGPGIGVTPDPARVEELRAGDAVDVDLPYGQ